MSQNAKFEILWPEKRWVSAEKIGTWFDEAVANGEIDGNYASAPQFSDPIEGPERKAMELHRLGTITLGGGRK